ncbi:hypothetical protein NL50_14935 [Clostridium acetobutylicum]|nr:hypothetical protein NL50_14935 [Clostridium acetobutylicum]
MKKEARYSETTKCFIVSLVLNAIFLLTLFVSCIYLSIKAVIGHTTNASPIGLALVPIILIVIVRPIFPILARCKYSLILQQDELKYTGWVKHMIVKYEDIESINSIAVVLASPYTNESKNRMQFIQIKLKNKKQIKILSNYKDDMSSIFHWDLAMFTNKEIKYDAKFILFIR